MKNFISKHHVFVAFLALLTMTVLAGLFMYSETVSTALDIDGWNYYAPEQKAQEVAPTSEVAGWKTYHNEKYGFEFSYPDEWVIYAEDTGSVFLMSENPSVGPRFSIYFENSPKKTPDMEIAEEQKTGMTVTSLKKTKIADLDAVQFESGRAKGLTVEKVYFKDGDKLFKVLYYNILSEKWDPEPAKNPEYNKVLQSFSFFEPQVTVDIATWKTYRNEKYAFEVKYPADWRLDIMDKYDATGKVISLQSEFWLSDQTMHRVLIMPLGYGIFSDKRKDLVETKGLSANGVVGRWREFGYVGGIYAVDVDQFSQKQYPVFEVVFTPVNAREYIDPARLSEFNYIMSTFKFIQ